MKVRFWGVRGSYPVPGHGTQRYGGNTSCVEIRDAGPSPIIIDAGTGMRRLGQELMRGSFGSGTGEAHVLVSHTHWDHIQGLPFFEPVYRRGNRLNVYALERDDTHLQALFSSQTDAQYFPIPRHELEARIEFHELKAHERFELGPVKVSCTRLNHPWIAIGYRLDFDGRSVAYVTDTAPFRDVLLERDFVHTPPRPGEPLAPEDARKLASMREGVVRLCEGADVVIYDTQFTAREYLERPHWGHSCPEDALEIANEAGAKTLALFHHAPERTDDELDAIVEELRRKEERLDVLAAAEGLELTL